MTRTTRIFGQWGLGVAVLVALGSQGCGDGDAKGDDAAEEETGDGDGDGDGDGESDGDGGEEPPPGDGSEQLCDAGDEAWVKRAIPLIQGRAPESIREVRMLVSMIEQLDAEGEDGREMVARGLASGTLYLARWETFFMEETRVNRIEVKANYDCYVGTTANGDSADLAAFVRDNYAQGTDFGSPFTARDVLRSALVLDDVSPWYRADLFARMGRPLTGANVSEQDLDQLRRTNYGEIFEGAYLGRKSGCLECHNSKDAVTWDPDPDLNRHWAIDGWFEQAIYGAHEGRPEEEFYAAFRWNGFADTGTARPWGMNATCGRFTVAHAGDLWGHAAYLGGPLPDAAHLFDVEPLLKDGIEALVADGLDLGDDLTVPPDQSIGYLLAVNVANHVWREAMGFPLTTANGFSRNAKQREILQDLGEAFIASGYSPRALLAEVATHPYFNQAGPDTCSSSTPYHLEPVFDPFTIAAADPNAQKNGVGDSVHRFSAWALMDRASHAMWWERPDRFGPRDDSQYGDGGITEMAQSSYLESQGIFLKDAKPGFNGVDFAALLYWEDRLGAGIDPGLDGDCAGPLGQGCASLDFVASLMDELGDSRRVEDAVLVLKDRLVTEPDLGPGEREHVEAVVGFSFEDEVGTLDTVALEAGLRRYVAVLLNSPQFMLAGLPSPDQQTTPEIVIPGTQTQAVCEHLAPTILDADAWTWSCDGEAVTVTKK